MTLEPMGLEELREEVDRLHALLEGKTQYVDCACPGCPRKVPEAWAAGMCEPCCHEDCDHGDGALALIKERDEAQAELAAALKERDEARTKNGEACDQCQLVAASAEAETDRLRAALEPLEDDITVLDSNMELHAILQEVRNGGSEKRLWRAVRSAHLAAIRAKAGRP